MIDKRNDELARCFGPWLSGEAGTAVLGYYMMDRSSRYNLEIINIIANENRTEIYQRIPQEVFGGFVAGGRANVQASVVARAGESPVRQDRGGLQDEEIDNRLAVWSRQEALLETWANSEGLWHTDALKDLESLYGEEIAHGTEAHVFMHTDGIHAVKAISCMFNPQETLDRIALTNHKFPQTGLVLTGLGRGEEGELVFIVEQPFIHGTHMDEGECSIPALEDFEPVPGREDNPMYATPHILVGDLHDRNVLRTPGGLPAVIDCNIYLNTPDLGMGGKWVIPPVSAGYEQVNDVLKALAKITPITVSRKEFLRVVGPHVENLEEVISKQCWGTVNIPTRDGGRTDLLFERDPESPLHILWSVPERTSILTQWDHRFSTEEQETLAHGKTVRKSDTAYRFSLDRGRVIEDTQMILRLSEKNNRPKGMRP